MCIASDRPQSKQCWQCSPGHMGHLTCINIIKSFQRRWLDCWRTGVHPTKHWSLLQYVGVGFDHFMVLLFLCHQNHPVQDGGQLDCSTLILIFVSLLGTGVRRQWLRQWPVRCRMARLFRGSIRPAGGLRDAVEEGEFIINTHLLSVLYHFRELPLQPVQ